MSVREEHTTASPVLHCYFTKKGGDLITRLQHIAPRNELSSILTLAAASLLVATASRRHSLPPEKDVLFLTFFDPQWKGKIIVKHKSKAKGSLEIPLPQEFFQCIEELKQRVTYKDENGVLRHVFLFAHYIFTFKRQPCLLH